MAGDNPVLPATGIPVAGDEGAGGEIWQYVKAAFGADNTQTKVTSSVGLPVADAGGSLTVDSPELTTLVGLLGTSTASQVWKSWAVTTTQTGGTIWTPASGKKIAINVLHLFIGGSTDGTVTLWFGASGDTTYSAGTDQVAYGPWTVIAANAPFATPPLEAPILSATADYLLRITTSAGITCAGEVYGYEF